MQWFRPSYVSACAVLHLFIAPAAAWSAAASPQDASVENLTAVRQQINALDAQGRYQEAERQLMKLLSMQLSKLGEKQADVADTYDKIGENLRAQKRFSDALSWHEKAWSLRVELFGENHGWVAYSHDQIANTYYALDQFANAEPHVRKALDIRRAALGENNKNVIEGYLKLAIAIDGQRRPAEAEPYFRKALDLSLNVFGENDLLTARAYAGLSSCLFHQGRAADSEQLEQKAFAIRLALSGENSEDAAHSHSGLADNLQIQGRYSDAEPHYRKILEIYLALNGEHDGDTARAYTDLGINLAQQGRFIEAQPLVDKGREINSKVYGEVSERSSYSFGALAYLSELQNEYADAEPMRRKEIAIRVALLGADHPDLAENYESLASVLRNQGRLIDAEAAEAQAVKLLRIGRRTQSKGLAPSRAKRNVGVSDNSQVIFRNYLALASGIAHPSSGLDQKESERIFPSAFLVAQDLLISAAGTALVGAAARTLAGSDDLAIVMRQEQDAAERVKKLDQEMLSAMLGNDALEAKKLREAYAAESQALNLISQEIDREFPEYRQLISPEPLAIDEIEHLLDKDEALIMLVATDHAIYSFGVGPGGHSWNRVSSDLASIYEWIANLRCDVDQETCSAARLAELEEIPLTAAERDGYRRYDLDAAVKLYSAFISAIEPALRGAKRLYVTSSGSLGDLPLGMLVSEKPQGQIDFADPDTLNSVAWLSNRFAITTLPSVSALRLRRKFTGSSLRNSGIFLGYGNPVLGPDGTEAPRSGSYYRSDQSGVILADPVRLGTLSSLPGTKVELLAMARLFGESGNALRLGTDATEHNLKSDKTLSAANVVAFATHGLLPNGSTGMDEPGIVFTPPQIASAEDDGILGASEAASLRLNADWVILSACNTASTAMGAGGSDSLSALSSAFLYAGAHALLASHWRVSDEATALLTVETLEVWRTNSNISRAQALQIAMRAIRTGHRDDGTLIKGWDPGWAHPSIWAPFSHIANGDE